MVTARVFKAVPLNQIASFNFTVKWHQRQSSPGPDSDLQGGFKVEGDWALEKSTVVKRHSHNQKLPRRGYVCQSRCNQKFEHGKLNVKNY